MRSRFLLASVLVMSGALAHRDHYLPARTEVTHPTSPTSASSDPAGFPFTGPISREDWSSSSSPLYTMVSHAASTAVGGRADAEASDGKALVLTIPAKVGSTPAQAAEVDSVRSYLYGSFSSRVRTADCAKQPSTGAVTGIFTYGNDGHDHDGDGLTDNSEIDVEILCARPNILNLTIWTDYDQTSKAQREVSRVIDLAAGRVLSTCYTTSDHGDCAELSCAEANPSTVPAMAGFNSATAYYNYRIDWTADRVRFTVSDDTGRQITLWDYQGPSTRIPHNPSAYLINLWHTADWTPDGAPAATRSPTSPLTAFVDSSSVTSLT